MTGCSAVLVARLNGVQEAVSSILATRTKSSSVERLKSFLFYLELLQTTEPQSFGRLRLCFILLYLPSARSFASFSSKGLRYWPVKLPGTSATCSGVPSATMRPPALPPSGPRSMM